MRKSDDRFAEAERLWEDGEFEKAMAVYNQILSDETIPKMARAIVCEYIGRLHVGMGNIATAEKYLTAAVKMNPDGVEHHVQLANCLCLASRQEDAWELIHQLYRRFPEHPAAMHYMGKMLDERGDHERGFELMKQAIKLDPMNERFLADLSFAYMMRGNAGAAMICSEEAMSLNPNDEVVQFIHEVATEFEKQESEKQKSPTPRTQWRKRRNPSQKASRPGV
ncbi:tetratricopeptide repeat protein [candidate division KSB1 bacterium]|nr:tetratricopeptide repeat protein [candidate division KSB1 bacterium]